jgi:hypothetical protein
MGVNIFITLGPGHTLTSVDEIIVHKIATKKMSADIKSVDKMSVDKMSTDRMSADQNVCIQKNVAIYAHRDFICTESLELAHSALQRCYVTN